MSAELSEKEATEAAKAMIDMESADKSTTYYGQGRGYMLWMVSLLYKHGFAVCVKEE